MSKSPAWRSIRRIRRCLRFEFETGISAGFRFLAGDADESRQDVVRASDGFSTVEDFSQDRGYVDFARLHTLYVSGAFFVTRSKSNLKAHRVYSMPVDRNTGIICDQRIALEGFYAKQDYPEQLRRVRFNDPETGKALVFLSNQMTLPAMTICILYKNRWKVELFFKWIKQHLRIKKSFGTSENAVKTQIWIAVSVYVLVAIIKKRLNLNVSLYTLLTDIVGYLFREDALVVSLSERWLHYFRQAGLQSIESIHNLTGQQWRMLYLKYSLFKITRFCTFV